MQPCRTRLLSNTLKKSYFLLKFIQWNKNSNNQVCIYFAIKNNMKRVACIQHHTSCFVWFSLFFWHFTWHRTGKNQSFVVSEFIQDFPLIFLLALCMPVEFLSHNSYNFLLILMEHSYLMLLSSSHKMPIDVIDITLNNWCDVYHFLVYTHSSMQNIKSDYSLWKLPFEILTLSSVFHTVCYAPVSAEMITSQMELIQ